MSRSSTDSLRRSQRQLSEEEQTLPRYGNQRKLQAQLKIKNRRSERQRDKESTRQALQSRDH